MEERRREGEEWRGEGKEEKNKVGGGERKRESRESEGKIVLCVGIQKGEKKKKKRTCSGPVDRLVWGFIVGFIFFYLFLLFFY